MLGATDMVVHETRDGSELERLWLETLRALANRAAHEVRGALNGVALNLEVVRARAEKPGAAASWVVPFASSAAEQLEVLTGLTEAFISLARGPHRPLDVRTTVGQVVRLLAPAMRSEGGHLELAEVAGDAATVTSAEPESARLAIAAVLITACTGARRVVCRIVVRDAIILRVEGADGSLVVAPDVDRAVTDAGIGLVHAQDATIVAFPAESR